MAYIARTTEYYQVAAPRTAVKEALHGVLDAYFPGRVSESSETLLRVDFPISPGVSGAVQIWVESPTGSATESAAARVKVLTNVNGQGVEAGDEPHAQAFFDRIHGAVRQVTDALAAHHRGDLDQGLE